MKKLEGALTAAVVLVFAGVVASHVGSWTVTGEKPSLILAALVSTGFGLLHAAHTLGWKRALTFFATCSVLSFLAEAQSIATGNVGDYYYTAILGPKLGTVPLVIPLTWFMMLYPSHVIANLIIERKARIRRGTVALAIWLAFTTAVLLTAWDLVLDPYMSGKVKAWIWEDGGPYFGVPYMNFLGWLRVAFVIDLVYRLLARGIPMKPIGKVKPWMALLPLVTYALNGVGDIFIGWPTETRLIVVFVMGVTILVASARLLKHEPEPSPELLAVPRGGERKAGLAIAAVAGVLMLVVSAFALRPLFVGDKVPFVQLVPVFALFSLAHAWALLGWRRALAFMSVAAILSFFAEYFGTTTGGIFGEYYYTDVLGPKILGEVPVVIPFTWFLMIYPSYLIANLIASGHPLVETRSSWKSVLWLSLLGGMVMTAWDLTLDPYMVGFEKAWVWTQGGSYFGIPIQNYVGWVATTFLVFVVFRLLERHIPLKPQIKVTRTFVALPLLTYGFMAVGDIVIGEPPATLMIAPFAMGIPLLFAATALARWRPAKPAT